MAFFQLRRARLRSLVEGLVQRVRAESTEGDAKDAAERFQDYGLAANPVDGQGLVLHVDGHTVVVRMDRLAERPALAAYEVALWHKEGHRITLRAGGVVEITGTKLVVNMGGAIELHSSQLTHNGKNVGDTHTHGGVDTGGGSPADYARWALTVASITRAWGVRNPAGPTSAGVIIMADGNEPDGVPTTVQRDLVRDFIRDPRRGPPDELFVIIPTLQVINFTIHLDVDSTATRTATSAALRDLFFREAVPGGSIPMSHAVEVISAVAGEYNHTISAPAITSGGLWTATAFDRLLALGAVTFV